MRNIAFDIFLAMSARAHIELKKGRVDEVENGDGETNDEGHLDVSSDVGVPAWT